MPIDFARVHKQFPAVAEYVSGIYILQRDYGQVSNRRLAAWIGVSGSAVTQALTRLKRLGLAVHKRYEEIGLTPEGRSLAVQVLRRHYLLEHLLVRLLGYPWDRADDEAKLLQSEISDDLAEHLYRKLGAPQTCPHGNPMPGSSVELRLLSAPRLSDAPVGSIVEILRITEEGEQLPAMLAFCHSHGLQPGARFEVVARDERDLRLKDAGGTRSGDNGVVPVSLERAEHVRYQIPSAGGP